MNALANSTASAPEMTDIIDIKPLAPLGFDYTILLWALAAISLAALLYYLWRKYRPKKKEPLLPQPEPVKPHVAAFEALEALGKDSGHMEAREFHFALSGIFREYLDGRYGLRTLEMTLQEFSPVLEQKLAGHSMLPRLRGLSNTSEWVKFAGAGESHDKRLEHLELVRAFVMDTREEGDV